MAKFLSSLTLEAPQYIPTSITAPACIPSICISCCFFMRVSSGLPPVIIGKTLECYFIFHTEKIRVEIVYFIHEHACMSWSSLGCLVSNGINTGPQNVYDMWDLVVESFLWLHSEHLPDISDNCVVNLRSSASNLTCLLFHISLLFLQHRVTKLWASPNFKSLPATLLFISVSGCINGTFRVIKCL